MNLFLGWLQRTLRAQVLLAMLGLTWATGAWALSWGGQHDVDFGEVTIPTIVPGTPIGTVLAQRDFTMQINTTTSTNYNAAIKTASFISSETLTNQVWQTQVPGIGIKLDSTYSLTLFHPISDQVGSYKFADYHNKGTAEIPFIISLVVTGPIGTFVPSLASTPVFNLAIVNQGQSNLQLDPTPLTVHATFRYIRQTCTVSHTPITVLLPTALPSFLTAAGDTTGETPFKIQASCPDQNQPVTLSFEDKSNTASTDNYLKNSGTATHVGLQILKDGLPVQMQGPISLNSSSSANMTIPLSARYYATDGAATAGSIRAAALFTLFYQ